MTDTSTATSGRGRRWFTRTAALVATATAAGAVLAAPAQAVPLFPGGPEIPDIQVPTPQLQLPSGFQLPTVQLPPGFELPPQVLAALPAGSVAPALAPIGPANFTAPSLNPAPGEVVGVAQPIIVGFNEPIGDRAVAERAIRVTTDPPVEGSFYWINDRQVRWKPTEFWPANTQVTVDAGDSHSTFSIGDALVTYADDNTKQISVFRNGELVKTMPTSLGKPGHETPNGTYIVGEKYRDMYMDSSTYGVPIDDPEGYRTYVEYATRISYSGIFVHAAPWSVADQGHTNVSHGCLNVSTEDGKWFYENAKKGDPVIVQNTAGGILSGADGLGDWNR